MIEGCISETCEVTGWSLTKALELLQVSRSSYYRYRKVMITGKKKVPDRADHPDRILPEERTAIIAYAREHPDIRHRSLAWKMIDDDVAFVSPSTVYRILVEEDLICRWQPKSKRDKRIRYKGNCPDEKWQSDIRYVKISRRTYYLIVFIDEYSRYIVHHELMFSMDGNSVSLAALDAFSTVTDDAKPEIQTDNGSGYISHEFKLVLTDRGVGHHRIYPHCPEENGLVERVNRTLGEKIDEHEPADFQEAKKEISNIIDWYNLERLHSGINFLTPWDMYRGNPEQRLQERQDKLREAKQRRREENLNVRQRNLASDVKRKDKNMLLKVKRKFAYEEKPLLIQNAKLSQAV